jgi:hypothetical protein
MSRVASTVCGADGHRAGWRISDVLGDDHFDPRCRWLPAALSGTGHITCLTRAEQLRLSHVELGAYTHLVAAMQTFIAPTLRRLAHAVEAREPATSEALFHAATEDVKHMALFREVRARLNADLGFPLVLLPEVGRVTGMVLDKQLGAVLLLTASIELLAERHYLTCFHQDTSLDPLVWRIFNAYWREASRPARLEFVETLRVFERMALAERDQAIDDFVALMRGLDEILSSQARFDVENLLRSIRRPLTSAERAEVLAGVLAAKRYTFIESGLAHPTFRELFSLVATRAQRLRVEAALGTTLAIAA